MTQTTKQKLASDPWAAYMIDDLPDPVKLSPGQDATEDYPVLHKSWYVPLRADHTGVASNATS